MGHTELAIILGLLLVDGEDIVGVLLRRVNIDVARVPDEALEELVRVLLLNHHSCSLDDVACILDELLAVWGERVDVDGGVGCDVAESLVDLGVGGHAALAEGLDNAIEADLAVDVGLLVGLDDGVDDGALGGVCGNVFWCVGERHGSGYRICCSTVSNFQHLYRCERVRHAMTHRRHQVRPGQWNLHNGVRSPWSAEKDDCRFGPDRVCKWPRRQRSLPTQPPRAVPHHNLITTGSRLEDKTMFLGGECVAWRGEGSSLCHLEYVFFAMTSQTTTLGTGYWAFSACACRV